MADLTREALDQLTSALITALSAVDRARAALPDSPVSNVKPAPLFLGEKNASAVLTGSAGLRIAQVPIAPLKLVDEVKSIEPKTAQIIDWPDAPLPAEDALAREYGDETVAPQVEPIVAPDNAAGREYPADAQVIFPSPYVPQGRSAAERAESRAASSGTTIDGELWQLFLSDYLRPSAPSVSACYRRIKQIAAERGITIPSDWTFRRALKAEPSARKARRHVARPDATASIPARPLVDDQHDDQHEEFRTGAHLTARPTPGSPKRLEMIRAAAEKLQAKAPPRTKPSADPRKARLDIGAAPQSAAKAQPTEAETRAVEDRRPIAYGNEACRRCGARAAIGCEHQRPDPELGAARG